jgi:hypothetical protein
VVLGVDPRLAANQKTVKVDFRRERLRCVAPDTVLSLDHGDGLCYTFEVQLDLACCGILEPEGNAAVRMQFVREQGRRRDRFCGLLLRWENGGLQNEQNGEDMLERHARSLPDVRASVSHHSRGTRLRREMALALTRPASEIAI